MFVYDDGGRQAAGFPGRADDSVIRALAIALPLPYKLVRAALAHEMRITSDWPDDPDGGVPQALMDKCLQELGWRFVLNDQHTRGFPVLTMRDLPVGRYVIEFRGPRAGHVGALVDGEYRDLFDATDSPVWGFWWPRHVRNKDGSPVQEAPPCR